MLVTTIILVIKVVTVRLIHIFHAEVLFELRTQCGLVKRTQMLIFSIVNSSLSAVARNIKGLHLRL